MSSTARGKMPEMKAPFLYILATNSQLLSLNLIAALSKSRKLPHLLSVFDAQVVVNIFKTNKPPLQF